MGAISARIGGRGYMLIRSGGDGCMWLDEADRLAAEVRARFPKLTCEYTAASDMFCIGVGDFLAAKVPGMFRDKLMGVAEAIAD